MNIFCLINKKIKRVIIRTKYKSRLKNKNFTLICQNCIGGVIYSELGLPFMSPTINMFIDGENFVKFVENLRHYLQLPATPVCERYIEPLDKNVFYPKIKVGDVELCCLHYSSCEEAIAAWERRKARVNYDKIYVIGNSWNLHNDKKLIDRLCSTEYKTIIFTTFSYDNPKCLELPQNDDMKWTFDCRGIIRPNITDDMPDSSGYKYFEKFFDFVKWLNM